MKEIREYHYQSLLRKLDSETEADLRESLLSSVRKRKRQRVLTACFATAAVFSICGIAVTLQTKEPAKSDLAFSEIRESGNWTEIESRPQFTEVTAQSNFEFETISLTTNSLPKTVDEQGLIDLFHGRPIMISYATGDHKNQFWLLEDNAL